jgi:phage FluMu protein Com
MSQNRCPHCQSLLSENERLSGQCPMCKTFFESKIPGAPERAPVPVTPAPVIRTGSSERSGKGSGIGNIWWVIIVGFIALRACTALMRTNYDSPSSYDSSYESSYEFDPQQFEMPTLDQDDFPYLPIASTS